MLLLTRLKEHPLRRRYSDQAKRDGWSRATLEVQIRNRLLERQGQAITNFDARLTAPHSRLAHETLKDPYLFDFLGLGVEAQEREIETALMRHITRFLLELGTGFAFIGRQYRLEVAGEEFFVDLLFYHTRLKCYVVVELKATAFRPEHAGQLNFYLSAVDAQLKASDDKLTIGLLLCKSQNRLVAEYSLSGIGSFLSPPSARHRPRRSAPLLKRSFQRSFSTLRLRHGYATTPARKRRPPTAADRGWVLNHPGRPAVAVRESHRQSGA